MTDSKELQLASSLVMVIGVGYLFPFSALTQPIDYWHKVFPDFNLEFPLTTCYMWVNLVALGFMVFRGKEPSFTFRIVGGFIGQFLVLLFVPSLYFLHLNEWWNYVLIMVAVSFAAISTSMIDSVAISLVAQYPRQMQVSLQVGIGLSTLIGSVYRLVTKAIFPPEAVVESSMLYFYCGAVTILTGVGAYYWLLALPLSLRSLRYGMHKTYSTLPASSAGEDEDCFQDSPVPTKSVQLPSRKPRVTQSASDSNIHASAETSLLSAATRSKNYQTSPGPKDSPSDSVLDAAEGGFADSPLSLPEEAGGEQPSPLDDREPDKRDIFWRVLHGEWLVFLVYFTSLALWPPLITEIPSYNFPQLQATQWWPLLMLFLFAVMDCLGRMLTQFRLCFTRYNIHVVVYLRLLLAPLLICSAKGWLFTNDAWSVLFVAALAFSNGYSGSLAIILLNETVEGFERGVVGMFTGFFLNLGLVFGATASLGMEHLLRL